MFDVLPEMRCATRLNDGLMQLTNFFMHDQTFSGVLWLLSLEMEFPMGKNEQKRTWALTDPCDRPRKRAAARGRSRPPTTSATVANENDGAGVR